MLQRSQNSEALGELVHDELALDAQLSDGQAHDEISSGELAHDGLELELAC